MGKGRHTDMYSLTGKKVWVAGHNGMIGSALVRALRDQNCRVLTATRQQLDLIRQENVESWVAKHKPDAVFIAAANVAGIVPNNERPLDFLYENLAIATNTLQACAIAGVEKLLFLGSSCIYPAKSKHPIREEYLLDGPFEPTNEAHAVAKIAGIKLCQAYRRQKKLCFISAIACSIYGPRDNFHRTNAHMVAALMRRFHDATADNAPSVKVWGSGTPRREFLHADDLARAALFLMERYDDDIPINIGTGQDISIADFARLMADITGFSGRMTFDRSYPDGVKRKCLDVSRMNDLGWQASIPLDQGLRDTYAWFVANRHNLRE